MNKSKLEQGLVDLSGGLAGSGTLEPSGEALGNKTRGEELLENKIHSKIFSMSLNRFSIWEVKVSKELEALLVKVSTLKREEI